MSSKSLLGDTLQKLLGDSPISQFYSIGNNASLEKKQAAHLFAHSAQLWAIIRGQTVPMSLAVFVAKKNLISYKDAAE